jgi:hypothetical protein
MSNNDLFTNSQYGFRPGRSCVTQLLEVLDDWSELMDNGFSIDTIYLDFSKAFDSLPNQRLFLKLEKLGFEGSLLLHQLHLRQHNYQSYPTWYNGSDY